MEAVERHGKSNRRGDWRYTCRVCVDKIFSVTKSDWKALVWLYETAKVPREKELLGMAIRLIKRLIRENKRLKEKTK